MKTLFSEVYKNKTVLVTGHTGFKGSWLSFWLKTMGAKVVGYSLEAPTRPNHIELLDFDMISIQGDIRDDEQLNKVFATYKPDIVFHLAAQALVRLSYENPVETYETNVIGTLKVFEACRKYSVKAIVNITSDKAYENKELQRSYKEDDTLGGYDPYSASKGCSELLTASYRNSYFNLKDYTKTHNTLLASCRAGNVIGGGDWARDRLIPDIIRCAAQEKKIEIRNPDAIRPWQHVLEPLSAYLQIGQKLLEQKQYFAQAWNFGPREEESISVKEVVEILQKYWDKIDYEADQNLNQPHEAKLLKLDCSKAHRILKWHSVWRGDKGFEKTIKWYKAYYSEENKILTAQDLKAYIRDAKAKGLEWTRN